MDALAMALQDQGLGPGGRALLALPNSAAAVVAGLAVQLLGGTVVEVGATQTPEMLSLAIDAAAPRVAFVDAADRRRTDLLAGHPSIHHLWLVGEGQTPVTEAPGGRPTISHLSEAGLVKDPASSRAAIAPYRWDDPREPAVIIYTSGSTGVARGVMLSARNIVENTRSIVEYLHLTAEDRALLALPMSYCYGRSVLQTHLYVGGSIVFEDRFAFPRMVLETLAEERCTGFAGVPLTFELLRRRVDVSAMRFPALRYLTQAGGEMAPETIQWVREMFSPARLYVMYGQTEATARLAYLPPEDAERKRGSVGIAIPGVELRVAGDDGRTLPVGEVGQLVARGPNVCLGYLGDEEATARILRDGWLWTGDLAVCDPDGYFTLCGRADELMKVGGYRVSPVGIEHVLQSHPDVVEAAVVGRPDSLMGTVPVAFVVARAGTAPADADLRRWAQERLPPHEVPVEFSLIGQLPRNAAGKLLRAQVRALTGDDVAT
jgi:acyl-CoA synthetase (AMP-forming)/AMP-acid ligase II